MARCTDAVYNLRVQQIQFILDNITEPDYMQLDNCALDTTFGLANANQGFCPAGFTYTILNMPMTTLIRRVNKAEDGVEQFKDFFIECSFLRQVDCYMPDRLKSKTVGVNSIWNCYRQTGRLKPLLCDLRMWLYNMCIRILNHYTMKATTSPNPNNTFFKILERRFPTIWNYQKSGFIGSTLESVYVGKSGDDTQDKKLIPVLNVELIDAKPEEQ